MPSLSQDYEILLHFTNDMNEPITLQLLREYGRDTSTIILLNPAESITLVLDPGSAYRYALKMRNTVANVTARSWRDIHCLISPLFTCGARNSARSHDVLPTQSISGLTIDRLWRDHRFCVWSGA